MRIVFVGGVHGSGKSRLCEALAPKIAATYQVASDLLRRSRKSARQRAEGTNDKAVADVRANQEVILRAIAEFRGKPDCLLLDGHFCLMTTADEVQSVPLEYFRALAPAAMLLVEAEQSEVQRRLEQRDLATYPGELLASLARCELAHAFAVSEALSVPLKVLSGPSPLDEAVTFLAPLL